MEETTTWPYANFLNWCNNPRRSRIWLTQPWSTLPSLAIAKKTLDENCFRTAQKTTDREPPSFKIGNRVYFKKKKPGKWDLKQRPGYQIFCIEHDGHYLHIKNLVTGKTSLCNFKDVVLKPPVELWNINTQFGRAGRCINHPANLPTIMFTDWRWKLYSCTYSYVNNLHSSSFQHSMHDHTHQYNNMGEQGISIVPASIKSLPHMSSLDHHSSCIIGKSREGMENVH